MAGFNLKSNIVEAVDQQQKVSSQAYTIGDLMEQSRTTGGVIPATSSSKTTNVVAVAVETVDNTATTLLSTLLTTDQVWECATTNAVNAAHNGQRMVLTDKATVNNTGTDDTSVNAVVTQVGVSGNGKGLFNFNLTDVAA